MPKIAAYVLPERLLEFLFASVRQWHTVAIVEEMEYYHIGDSNRTPLEHGHELLHDYKYVRFHGITIPSYRYERMLLLPA